MAPWFFAPASADLETSTTPKMQPRRSFSNSPELRAGRGDHWAVGSHQVARHMALTLVRSRTRRSRREEEAAMRKVPSRPPTEEVLREELDQGIAQLPSRLREAVILCHLEGHKQSDAARILGCNQGTLSRWATDGLEQLRSLLAPRRDRYFGRTHRFPLPAECDGGGAGRSARQFGRRRGWQSRTRGQSQFGRCGRANGCGLRGRHGGGPAAFRGRAPIDFSVRQG